MLAPRQEANLRKASSDGIDSSKQPGAPAHTQNNVVELCVEQNEPATPSILDIPRVPPTTDLLDALQPGVR